jgi:hypothetical protein
VFSWELPDSFLNGGGGGGGEKKLFFGHVKWCRVPNERFSGCFCWDKGGSEREQDFTF